MTMNKRMNLWSLSLAFTLGTPAFVLTAGSMFSAPALAQQNCDIREYAEFVAYSQTLNPLTENLGRRMLQCANRDFRESAFYWLGFYYSMTNQAAKIPGLAKLMPPESDNSLKATAQRDAFLGNTKVLADKVFTSTNGYIDDPWIIMSLARAQMNTGEYSKAFANYIRVLRLKDDQDSAEVELLFAYIWAKDNEAARAKLASLKRYESSVYLKQSLSRAEALLKEESVEPKKRHDFLSLAYLQERDNRGYAATGGRAVYEGVLDIELEALEHTHPLEVKKEKVAIANFGKEWGEEHGARTITEIGYYSVGDDRITGKLGLDLPLGEHIEGGFGVARKPVSAFEKPPAGTRAGIMRDSAYWTLSWHERLDLTGAIHRDHNEAVYEDYTGEFKLGALPKGNDEKGFGVIVPFSYRHRPMPSPDYRSYPHDARVGVGFRLGLSAPRYSLYTEAVLESIQRDDYGDVNHYERLLGARAKAHLRVYFQKTFYTFFEGSAFTIEKMDGERDDEKSSEVLIGLGMSQESH